MSEPMVWSYDRMLKEGKSHEEAFQILDDFCEAIKKNANEYHAAQIQERNRADAAERQRDRAILAMKRYGEIMCEWDFLLTDWTPVLPGQHDPVNADIGRLLNCYVKTNEAALDAFRRGDVEAALKIMGVE